MMCSNPDMDWEAWCESIDKMNQEMLELVLEEMYVIGQKGLSENGKVG